MDERAIRVILADGLEAGAVGALRESGPLAKFLAGEIDFDLAALGMDSLARMELCIAIEVGTGQSLAPEELVQFKTLGDLVRAIARSTDA
jgi:hypothetical protein